MKRLALITFVFLFAHAAGATMVKPMSVEQLANAASLVVDGQASDTWASWNPQHTRIYTYTRVRVSRALKGVPADTVVVKQLGGSAGGYTQHVSGVQHMRSGERAVLFLRPSASGDGTMVIVGLMQGQFRVMRDSTTGTDFVSNGVAGADEMNSSTVREYRGSRLTLKEMETRVHKAVTRE